MSPIFNDVKHKQYSVYFDKLRLNAVQTSYYKYGPAEKNFPTGLVDAVGSLRRKLYAYERTGNTEYLIDVANYAMFEFMYSIHPTKHFKYTEDDRSTLPVGDPTGPE